MNSNHLTHCLVGIGAAVVLLVAFGVQAGTLGYLAVALACPLMMVVRMRAMAGGNGHGGGDHDHAASATGAAQRASERRR